MQKIIPHLWFDSEAEEAANLYASLFENSKIGKTVRYGKAGFEIHGQPEGKVMTVEFEAAGQKFIALNGGPLFKFTPAVSFLIACETKEEVDRIWEKLAEGGLPLMAVGAYPFSERYGWIQDKYGLSWQVMYMGDRPVKQKITPTLMFVGPQYGKAEEAINYYASVFHDASVGDIARYEEGEGPDRPGTIKHAAFTLEGQQFAAMDSAHQHDFSFNEAISFLVTCADQKEIDHYWNQLSAVPEAEQCGWLKDKYGVSWQIVPSGMEEMLNNPDKEKADRAMNAMLQMKKFDIEAMKKASEV
ncbi:MAG TPA: VOC family protein [Candidatus Paceibacterota bacterium]|nr:VOC family protein [Candidatus Paceibacterota bacterium]